MITRTFTVKNYSGHREVLLQCTTIRTSHLSNHLMGSRSRLTTGHHSNHPMGHLNNRPTDNRLICHHSNPMGSPNTASHPYRVIYLSNHPKNAVLACGSYLAFSSSLCSL